MINACLTIQLKYNYTVLQFSIVYYYKDLDFANIKRVKISIFITCYYYVIMLNGTLLCLKNGLERGESLDAAFFCLERIGTVNE